MRMALSIVAVTTMCVVSAASPTSAWEVDGYRSGMSLAQVRDVTKKARQRLIEGDLGDNGVRSLAVDVSPNPAMPELRSLSMCGDKLWAYTRQIDGGPEIAIRIGTDLTRRHGEPTAQYGEIVNASNAVLWLKTSWRAGIEQIDLVWGPASSGGRVQVSQLWWATPTANGCTP